MGYIKTQLACILLCYAVTQRWSTVTETCRRQHNEVGYKTVVF